MNYCDYSVIKEGSRGYSLTLPCFCDESRFYDAMRMNRFYCGVMNKLYSEAINCTSGKERRSAYRCDYTVQSTDISTVVTLTVTLRRYGERTLRKTAVQEWKNGYIIRSNTE